MRPKLYGKQDMTDFEEQARDAGMRVAERLLRHTLDDTNNDPITLSKLDARALVYVQQESGQVAHAVIGANKILMAFVEVVVSDELTRDELTALADMTLENAREFASCIGETKVEV